MKKIIAWILAVLMAVGMAGCSGGVAQEDYDRVLTNNIRLEDEIEELKQQLEGAGSESLEYAEELLEGLDDIYAISENIVDGVKVLHVLVNLPSLDYDVEDFSYDLGERIGRASNADEFDYDFVVVDTVYAQGILKVPVVTLFIDMSTLDVQSHVWPEE